MSPVYACPHGGIRRTCPACKRARERRPPERRGYSDTAAYRQMREAVLEAYGEACLYCALSTLDPAICAQRGELVLAHHPIPHADGGPFELENLRPAHRSCNAAAGRGTPSRRRR